MSALLETRTTDEILTPCTIATNNYPTRLTCEHCTRSVRLRLEVWRFGEDWHWDIATVFEQRAFRCTRCGSKASALIVEREFRDGRKLLLRLERG